MQSDASGSEDGLFYEEQHRKRSKKAADKRIVGRDYRRFSNRSKGVAVEGVVSDEASDGSLEDKRADFDGVLRLETNLVPQVEQIWRKSREGKFLVQWRGRAHWFDSWESGARVRECGGQRKLEYWERVKAAQLEDEDVEGEIEQYTLVERVVDLAKCDGVEWYLCKWTGLPYGSSTWERAADIFAHDGQAAVDAFLVRRQAGAIAPCAASVQRRSHFSRIESTPFLLGTLRPYQLEGVN